MVSMFLYVLGVMYSPGPVNLLGINIGLNDRINKSIGFFMGVGLSMFIYCFLFGIGGEKVIKEDYLIYFSIAGSIYILYLAFKLWTHNNKVEGDSKEAILGFENGFVIQVFNPKAILATLPIATVYFPSNNIKGFNIFIISFIIGVLAFFAPFTYSLIGKFLSSFIKKRVFFSVFNKVMSVILLLVAVSILWEYVF
ncbi:LysE family transporter [Iocasia frigidifontis]|uniref:LysE family transporter n=1 Tax=Iocasia fonsfrigidae TaxID=2682810 RepID=A0A8A7K7M5_9FIRM|nr:LysE family transporter [Iocasia fonsfrigidae]QTL97441.1 LysE family transporter [Iocasia fonsfrigidae]